MELKPGVWWPEDMHPAMWMARGIVDQAHLEWTNRVAVCTSAKRAQSTGGSSLHPKGRAMDVRTWYLGDPYTAVGKERIRDFAAALRERLGPDFDVVVEGPAATDERYRRRVTHIHVEYQPDNWAEGEG